MKVKIRKLDPTAMIPSYAHSTDAAMDLTATSIKVIDQGKFGYYEYGTSLALEIPKGFAGFIFPRSSISNKGLILSNSVGVIDSGYRGEIKFRFKHIKDSDVYNVGDRIGQLVILPIPEVEFEEVIELQTSDRNEGGFGSTGGS
jgi:dUTP pyrophosphatase